MRGDGLVADLAEEGDLVGSLRLDKMIDHVQLAELEVGELLVADVTREDGDGVACFVNPSADFGMVGISIVEKIMFYSKLIIKSNF